MSVTERPRCQARNSATELQLHSPSMAPSSGFSCAAYCERWRLGDRRRRQAVDAADPLGHAAEYGEFAAARKSALADRRAAKRAVIVGVDEARRQRAPVGVDCPVRASLPAIGATAPSATMMSSVDQRVAGKGGVSPSPLTMRRVADELASSVGQFEHEAQQHICAGGEIIGGGVFLHVVADRRRRSARRSCRPGRQRP